jgi:3-hydroxybutyryl-CoA dehydrogenase
MAGFTRVAVVGCGVMGSGIAEVSARAGLDVLVCEANEQLAERGAERVRHSLERAVRGGKLSEADKSAALARLRFAADLAGLSDRQVVFEAVPEDPQTKAAVLARIDAVLPTGAVIGTNTSSMPIIRLARATKRPERVLGVHFFNPVPVQPLVEVIPSLQTDESVVDTVISFVRDQLGKTAICSKDRAGFVVSALLIPYLLSAIRMYESGFGTAEAIDTGMEKGCAHPMGPLRLCDLIGLDVVKAIADTLFDEFKEPLYGPPPLLLRMVEAGWLGRKSGRGFYTYGPNAH